MRTLKKLLVLVLGVITPLLSAQEESLEDYIRTGLGNNLALKQKEVSYEKSLYVLQQARSLFYPDISMNMRYSAAKGGRLIEFPVGTMLNPVLPDSLRTSTGRRRRSCNRRRRLAAVAQW